MPVGPSLPSVLRAVWDQVNAIHTRSLGKAKEKKDRLDEMDKLEAAGGGDTIRMDGDTKAELTLILQSSRLFAVWDTFRKLCLSKPEEIASGIESVLLSIRNGIVKEPTSVLYKPDGKYIGINYHELAELI